NNAGIVAGGIGLGEPYNHNGHNFNVRIANDRMIGNGGLTQSGGVGIFYGSNGYEVANNIVCANFSVNYGAGVSHIGLSPGGKIHDNQIYYNESVDSGAGIALESELPVGGGTLGDGTGTVDVDRHLLQSNYSAGDGAALRQPERAVQQHLPEQRRVHAQPARTGRDSGGPGLHRLRNPRDDEPCRHLHTAVLVADQRPDPRPGRRAARTARQPGQP